MPLVCTLLISVLVKTHFKPALGPFRGIDKNPFSFNALEGGVEIVFQKVCEGFVRHRPPDPTLESASPSPPQGSIWHRFDIDSTSISWLWPYFDAKLTPEEGRARWIRGWGPRGLCLINIVFQKVPEAALTQDLSAPNRAIWLRLRLRLVIRIANRKSLAIWDDAILLRKAHCSDLLYKKLALRF